MEDRSELEKRTVLHITDGDSVASTLRESTVSGDVKVYGDQLYEGPVPTGVTPAQWRDVRAQFLSDQGNLTLGEARSYLGTLEDSLDVISKYDETVLWLDHRLSDQLILIRVLHHFCRLDLNRSELSLVCIGEHPDVDHFAGLGQLTAVQLNSLADTRIRVSAAQLRLANAAWSAFTSADPTAVEQIIARDCFALSFLAAALRRHLEQFPSIENGLSRTERQILLALRENGPSTARKLFAAVQQMEHPPFMGDLSFFGVVKGMVFGPMPARQRRSHQSVRAW